MIAPKSHKNQHSAGFINNFLEKKKLWIDGVDMTFWGTVDVKPHC